MNVEKIIKLLEGLDCERKPLIFEDWYGHQMAAHHVDEYGIHCHNASTIGMPITRLQTLKELRELPDHDLQLEVRETIHKGRSPVKVQGVRYKITGVKDGKVTVSFSSRTKWMNG